MKGPSHLRRRDQIPNRESNRAALVRGRRATNRPPEHPKNSCSAALPHHVGSHTSCAIHPECAHVFPRQPAGHKRSAEHYFLRVWDSYSFTDNIWRQVSGFVYRPVNCRTPWPMIPLNSHITLLHKQQTNKQTKTKTNERTNEHNNRVLKCDVIILQTFRASCCCKNVCKISDPYP